MTSILKMILRAALILAATALAGCGATSSLQGREASGRSSPEPARASSTATTPARRSPRALSRFVAAGARSDAGRDEWILLPSGLQVSRDAGHHWRRLPLPAKLGVLTAGPMAFAVFKDRTVAVAESKRVVGIDIYTLRKGSTRWRRTFVHIPREPLGEAEIVDRRGAFLGVMVREATNTNFSIGWWVSRGRGATGWQVHELPAAGAITAAQGLWLVGGVEGRDVYHSADGGGSWRKVQMPVSIGPRAGPTYRRVEVDGGTLVLLAGGRNLTQVLIKRPGAPWQPAKVQGVRHAVLHLGGGVPEGSLADGVLWIRASQYRIARIEMATGRLSVVEAKGLPRGGGTVSPMHALGRRSAWLPYSVVRCTPQKSDCRRSKGIVVTTDGGANWSPAPYRLAE